jgi:hypothetical protein
MFLSRLSYAASFDVSWLERDSSGEHKIGREVTNGPRGTNIAHPSFPQTPSRLQAVVRHNGTGYTIENKSDSGVMMWVGGNLLLSDGTPKDLAHMDEVTIVAAPGTTLRTPNGGRIANPFVFAFVKDGLSIRVLDPLHKILLVKLEETERKLALTMGSLKETENRVRLCKGDTRRLPSECLPQAVNHVSDVAKRTMQTLLGRVPDLTHSTPLKRRFEEHLGKLCSTLTDLKDKIWTEEEIQRKRKREEAAPEICPCCLEPPKEKVTLACKHFLCTECHKRITEFNITTCPICRQ